MSKQTLPQIATVTLISCAFVFLWGAVVDWLRPVLTTREVYTQERIEVARDGTPFIESRLSTDWNKPEFRTLDGRMIDVRSIPTLRSARFSAEMRPPGLWTDPVPWNRRIYGFYSSSKPESRWYYILKDPAEGRAYFGVYDVLSKLPVGFLGRSGFRSAIPPRSEWFEMDRSLGNSLPSGPIAMGSPGMEWVGYYPHPRSVDTSVQSQVAPWLVFIKDGDVVREINTQDREIRTLYESSSLHAISSLTAPDKRDDKISEPNQSAENGASTSEVQKRLEALDVPTSMRLAVRTGEHIAILDPLRNTSEVFNLPVTLREARFSVYSVGDGELLLQFNPLNPQTAVGCSHGGAAVD